MFVGLHATLATMTQTPELAITEQEGKDFMKAAQNVMRHYSVQSTQKTLDWLAFAGAASGMYGTRLFAINMRKRMAESEGRGTRGTVLKFPDRPPIRPAPAASPPDQTDLSAYVPSVHPGEPGGEGF